VRGLKEALHMLEVALPEEARKLNREVAKDAAQMIVDEAKPLMPRGRSGRLQRGAYAKAEPESGRFARASVRVRNAFYWRFLEYGDGPDGVEHAFFLRAKEKVMNSGAPFASFAKRLTARLRKWK